MRIANCELQMDRSTFVIRLQFVHLSFLRHLRVFRLLRHLLAGSRAAPCRGRSPSASASKLRITRCRIAGRKTRRTSSKLTLYRPLEQRPHLGGQRQRLRAARAAAPAQILVGDRHRERRLRDASPASAGRCSPARAARGSLRARAAATARSRAPSITLSGLTIDALRRAVDDRVQLLAAGIADDQLEEEAVELRFGQRIRAFLLDRVLRGHHEERLLRA